MKLTKCINEDGPSCIDYCCEYCASQLSLKSWQEFALPFIQRQCEGLGEHIAVCRMELQKGREKFKPDELIDPDVYLADIEAEHEQLRQLLISAGVEL